MRKLYVFIIGLLLWAHAGFAQCEGESILLTTQAEVNSFATNYPGCTTLQNLTIQGKISNLSGLSQLTSILGELSIDCYYYDENDNFELKYPLTSLAGLNNLTSVGGSLGLANFPNATTSNLFPALVSVGNYVSFSGTTTASIGGFNNLTGAGSFRVLGVQSLITISGFSSLLSFVNPYANPIEIGHNPLLISLPEFQSLTNVTGSIFITDNESLTETGFDHLETVTGSVHVITNAALQTLGFNNLQTVTSEFQIYSNPLLTNISTLSNFTTSGIIAIRNNPLLEVCNVPALCAYMANLGGGYDFSGNAIGCQSNEQVLVSCGVPQNCTDLTFYTQEAIDNFPLNNGCTSITGTLTINGASITNLDALESLTTVGALNISDVPNLINYYGLRNLATINGNFTISGSTAASISLPAVATIGGSYFITGTSALTTLPAMNNTLNTIGGSFSVTGNSALLDLTGVQSVVTINGSLDIHSNDALTNVSALSNLTTINGDLILHSNNSLTELTGIDNINPSTITSLLLYSSAALSVCNVPSICNFLSNSGANYIQGNADGCKTVTQVFVSCGVPQNCTDITLGSQSDIDSYPVNYGCSVIPGTLTIYGSDITNLNGLSQLNSVGNLNIGLVPNLLDYSGLDNLTTVAGNLDISGSTASNIIVFPGLLTIGGSLSFPSISATTVSGFSALTTIGGNLLIQNTANLNAFIGFDALLTIGISVGINSNVALTQLPTFGSLTSIGANLQISNNSLLQNLDSLETLTSINGHLELTDNAVLTSLSGLIGVTSINGNLNLNANNALTSLSGLDNIDPTTITTLYLYSSAVLSTCNVPSLCTFLSTGGSNYITGNANGCSNASQVMVACGGSVDCENIYLYSQADIDNYPLNYGCNSISGILNITGTDITNLNGLAQIAATGDLAISNVPALNDYSGLDNLTNITANFVLSGSTAAISGFAGLTTIGGSFLISSTTATSISGFANLASVGNEFNVGSNGSLTSMTGFSSLTTVGGVFSFNNNAQLVTLPTMNALISAGSFYFNNNASLSNLSGFDNLAMINGAFQVSGNSALTNVSALVNLVSISGTLYIYDNPVLTSLIGLGSINSTSIVYLYVASNPQLSVCGIPAICNYLSGGGSNFIAGNATGCANITQVLVACGTPQNCDNVYLYSQEDIDDYALNFGCSTIPTQLYISGSGITNLDGLAQIISVGNLTIREVPILSDFSGLDQLTSITGTLSIEGVTQSTISAFPNLTNIGGDFYVSGGGTPVITTLSGFGSLSTIAGSFNIGGTTLLEQLPTFSSLTTIGGDLIVNNNTSLTNLDGFSALTSVEGYLNIAYNSVLNSISGLSSINPTDLNYLYINSNNQLAVCNVPSICSYLSTGGDAAIAGNASGCEDTAEIISSCNTGCPSGDMYLASQTDVDNFAVTYPACTIVNGNLTISGEVTSLSGLSNLTSVIGNVSINSTQLTNLAGLNNLAHIYGNLTVANNPQLTNLTGLNSLVDVANGVAISSNTALTNLSGLNSLTTTSASLSIDNNISLTSLSGLDAMTTISGDVYIGYNAALTSLSGLSSLTTIGSSLTITDNPALVNIVGLNSLQQVSSNLTINNNSQLIALTGLGALTTINNTVTVSANASLASLTGLESLTTIASLSITGNPALISLNGLGVTTASYVNINDNDALLSLAGLSGLTEPDYLTVSANDSLTSLNGLNNVTSVYSLNVNENALMQHLTGLNNITNVTFLQISGNTALLDFDGLNTLTAAEYLQILANPALASLSGLNGLLQLNNLTISNNPALVDVAALANATTVNTINIADNPLLVSLLGLNNINPETLYSVQLNNNENLVTCNVASICEYLSNGGSAFISGNANGCATSLEVQIACGSGSECPAGDLTFTTQAQVDAFLVAYPLCTVIDGALNISGLNITNLNAFANIVTINGRVEIGSTALTSLSGLNQLTEVYGSVAINSNDNLVSVSALQSLGSIHNSDFQIASNPVISSLAGLENLTDINFLTINLNASLTTLTSFSTNFIGVLSVSDNPLLVSLNGLESVTMLGNLEIISNASLNNVDALQNVTGFGNFFSTGYLTIVNNDSLTSISGLGNLDPTTISSLNISDSANLSYCNVSSICSYIQINPNSYISGNAPGCENVTQVGTACGFDCRTYYIDSDGDGFGSSNSTQFNCTGLPPGFVINSNDCDDSDPMILECAPTVVNLKLFIEGYFNIVTGQMRPVKRNQGIGSSNVDVEELTIELHNAATYELVATTTALLQTNGNVIGSFSPQINGSYYIAVKGRNSLQTWSAVPQTLGAEPLSFDFTSASTQAYGDNMVEVQSGVWAIYSGDINGDNYIELIDFSMWEEDTINFATGNFSTDLNGDGFVELIDFTIWEANTNNFISTIMPGQ